jgi:hypothetical protein
MKMAVFISSTVIFIVLSGGRRAAEKETKGRQEKHKLETEREWQKKNLIQVMILSDI